VRSEKAVPIGVGTYGTTAELQVQSISRRHYEKTEKTDENSKAAFGRKRTSNIEHSTSNIE